MEKVGGSWGSWRGVTGDGGVGACHGYLGRLALRLVRPGSPIPMGCYPGARTLRWSNAISELKWKSQGGSCREKHHSGSAGFLVKHLRAWISMVVWFQVDAVIANTEAHHHDAVVM